ncbi:MAG: SAM-dependent methyltransferase [Gammaproteobacteria bacterium]|nr:SAM-dependent methyltransferase [Gammaproteobacteria bacterium]
MHSVNSHNILPEPAEELKCLSEDLAAIIRMKITENGPISFSDYMEMALYEPGLGYYSAGLQKFGEGGDFVTAPQLGNVFARCLANQIGQIGANLCQQDPGEYEIIEAGAGSGVLATDLLKALQDNHPPARYRILERSAHLRQVQKETLSQSVPQWMDKISWLDEPPETGWQGVFLANEVLDALTVDRFCVETDGIRQLQVVDGANGFNWVEGPCATGMESKIQTILSGLEKKPTAGYRSELNTRLPAWLQAVTTGLQKGVALFIDYGYPRRDYYQADRRDGTLICHYQHRAHNDPFKWPGLTDISASVDFTALAEAADECGLEVCGYTGQAMFLLGCGLDRLLAESQSLSETERLRINNQVRQLTLPGEMGERFQVMALGRGLDEDLAYKLLGFKIADLSHRL